MCVSVSEGLCSDPSAEASSGLFSHLQTPEQEEGEEVVGVWVMSGLWFVGVVHLCSC